MGWRESGGPGGWVEGEGEGTLTGGGVKRPAASRGQRCEKPPILPCCGGGSGRGGGGVEGKGYFGVLSGRCGYRLRLRAEGGGGTGAVGGALALAARQRPVQDEVGGYPPRGWAAENNFAWCRGRESGGGRGGRGAACLPLFVAPHVEKALASALLNQQCLVDRARGGSDHPQITAPPPTPRTPHPHPLSHREGVRACTNIHIFR